MRNGEESYMVQKEEEMDLYRSEEREKKKGGCEGRGGRGEKSRDSGEREVMGRWLTWGGGMDRLFFFGGEGGRQRVAKKRGTGERAASIILLGRTARFREGAAVGGRKKTSASQGIRFTSRVKKKKDGRVRVSGKQAWKG